MSLVSEFKEFALKGNVVDMAVGIIIGGAFSKIVQSVVSDIIMPLFGALAGQGSFGTRYLWMGSGEKPATIEAAKATGEPYLAWGPFLQTTIDFVILAFAIFMMIKLMNRARKLIEEPHPEDPTPQEQQPSEDILLLRQIRDSLAQKSSS